MQKLAVSMLKQPDAWTGEVQSYIIFGSYTLWFLLQILQNQNKINNHNTQNAF